MRVRIVGSLALTGLLLVGLVPTAAASNASCAGQFVSVVSKQARPLGQNLVVPEVRGLTLGGPNLGQEVKAFLATADKSACPVAP